LKCMLYLRPSKLEFYYNVVQINFLLLSRKQEISLTLDARIDLFCKLW
jgi:hypothetical protein